MVLGSVQKTSFRREFAKTGFSQFSPVFGGADLGLMCLLAFGIYQSIKSQIGKVIALIGYQ